MTTYVYDVGGKKLIWEDDDEVSDCPYNNLYIKDLWNMKDVLGRDDVCTDLQIISEDIFSFFSFNGFRVKIQIKDNEVKCLDVQLVR